MYPKYFYSRNLSGYLQRHSFLRATEAQIVLQTRTGREIRVSKSTMRELGARLYSVTYYEATPKLDEDFALQQLNVNAHRALDTLHTCQLTVDECKEILRIRDAHKEIKCNT